MRKTAHMRPSHMRWTSHTSRTWIIVFYWAFTERWEDTEQLDLDPMHKSKDDGDTGAPRTERTYKVLLERKSVDSGPPRPSSQTKFLAQKFT